MTLTEFSNEFDVLYNNITSNQAPGLDEYEKSVFLTKAQDEILKSYFDPKSNKVQEGFDGSERRQIDFSNIIGSTSYSPYDSTQSYLCIYDNEVPSDFKGGTLVKWEEVKEYSPIISNIQTSARPGSEELKYKLGLYNRKDITIRLSVIGESSSEYEGKSGTLYIPKENINSGDTYLSTSSFDGRENTVSFKIKEDILMFINEYVEVIRNSTERARLTVLPINYNEYSRLMSKPYKRPLKNQAWRLIGSDNNKKYTELVVGPNDDLAKYVIRYVKRPNPIILDNLEEGLSIGGPNNNIKSPCELDPILHHEILQRAVELAKAAYSGDLSSLVSMGQLSSTQIGVVPQQQSR